MSDIRYVAVGQQRFDSEGNREGTIIGSYHWPERVAEAGLTGEWLELILIPASRQDRDWSMLEAAQESIREKDAEIARLRTELAERRDDQEPVAWMDMRCLGPLFYEFPVITQPSDRQKLKMIPLYRHPPAPAAVVPEDFFDKLRAAFERLFWLERQGEGMPTEEVIDQGLNDAIEDQQENIRNMLQSVEPASRSESEIKAEALEEWAQEWERVDSGPARFERRGDFSVADLARMEANRLRGEGTD